MPTRSQDTKSIEPDSSLLRADPTPALIKQVRLILESEEVSGYDDSSAPGGLSAWMAGAGRAVGFLTQLANYSGLRSSTREQLAQRVMDKLEGAGSNVPDQANAPVTDVPGIGTTAAKQLSVLGIRTVGQLLRHRPHRYIDRSSIVHIAEARYGQEVTLIGHVSNIEVRPARSRRMRVVEATITDETGSIKAVWFNQAYLARTLNGRHNVALAGRIESGPQGLQLTSPEYELDLGRMVNAGRLVPVYPLTRGVSQRQVRRWVSTAIENYAGGLHDALDGKIRLRNHLPEITEAVRELHFPNSREAADGAVRRFAFEELLLYQLAIMRHRRDWLRIRPGRSVRIRQDTLTAFGGQLPFKLTGDQRSSLAEILTDLRRDRPMSRLLQGDVGSGKTAVAAGALFAVVGDGWQGAMLAPTEVLAEQHAQTLREMLQPLDVRVELITGGVPASDKRKIWRAVELGKVDVVVGTHAIIQRSSRFKRLNLAIVDEQHRFGVRQRSEMRAKGFNPHLLAMTATPIPRTLALTLYGDLDISTLRELPAGRRPVKTSFVPSSRRQEAYSFIQRQISAGRQVFIVFPIIDESDALNARAAVKEYERLSETVFNDHGHRVGLLHGRMSSTAKEKVMREFRDGDVNVLVSTAVVEVGIDVPNATVILIEGAERFGLAQLHQLRGRVGRGEHSSYCLLMSEASGMDENERLATLQTTDDGFVLAERDLELRGPGNVIGTRQSGVHGFTFASVTDLETVKQARREAVGLLDDDPDLIQQDHSSLANAVSTVLAENEWS